MKRALFLAIPVLLLAATILSQAMIDRTPEKKALVAANPFHKLPPTEYVAEYTATMLLGGLRAVAIDYLWIEEAKAERARQYLEVNAILEMIAYLEPSFSEVWNHLSWAKAYNIAAQMETREERWLWVKAGLESIDKAVQRNPGDPKLQFQKAYMYYHRVPQEEFLMEKCRQDFHRDCYEIAATTMKYAIEMAQAQGKANTQPPGDGIMQESYNRWAFNEMFAGNFDRAVSVLQQGHDAYAKLVPYKLQTDMNENNNQLFIDLIPVFRAEQQLASLKPGDPQREALERDLLETYERLERKYVYCVGVERRLSDFDGGILAGVFAKLETGDRDGAKADMKKIQDLVEARAETTRSGAQQAWLQQRDFYNGILAAIDLEAKSSQNAAKKYDDVLYGLGNIFHKGSPQLVLPAARAAKLRGR